MPLVPFDGITWRKGLGARFGGYFAAIDGDDRFDFLRSSCDDPRQVYHALGIEAARMVLLENMYHIVSNTDADIAEYGIASAGLPVHIAHMALLADTLCNGTRISTILSGASIQGGKGVVARKGSLSRPKDGRLVHYSDVLTIASYETAHRVLFDACKMGLTDSLRTPKAEQLTGNLARGYLGTPHRERGEYLVLVDELIWLREDEARLMGELDSMAMEHYGVTYQRILDDIMAGSATVPRRQLAELTARDDFQSVVDEVLTIRKKMIQTREALGVGSESVDGAVP